MKRVLLIILMILMVALYIPPIAFADEATYITITDELGVDHTFSNDSSGNGYSYNKETNTLTLNNFTGQKIDTDGNLNINLVGENKILVNKDAEELYGIRASNDGANGTITFTSEVDATLLIKAEDFDKLIYGVYGNMDIFDNCDITIQLTSAEMNSNYDTYGVWGYTDYKGTNSKVYIDITSKNVGSGILYGVYNDGLVCQDGTDNSLGISLHPAPSQDVKGLSNIYLYTENFELDIQIDDNKESENVKRETLGNINSIDKLTNGYLNLSGGVVVAYHPNVFGTPIKSTIPADDNFCIVTYYEESRSYFSDLSGNKLTSLKLVPELGEYSPRFVGDGLVKLPILYVDETVNSQMNYQPFQLSGYIRGLNRQTMLAFDVISGSLPNGLYINYNGAVVGTPIEECPAGSCVIRVTDSRNSYKYTDFTLYYDGVTYYDKFISVGGNMVEMKQSTIQDTWSYDGSTKTLTLKNYKGGPIVAEKAFNLHLVGTNTITVVDGVDDYVCGILVGTLSTNKTVTISGEKGSKLNIIGKDLSRRAFGVHGYTYILSNVNLNINMSISKENDHDFYGMSGTVTILGDNNTINMEVKDNHILYETRVLNGFYNGGLCAEGGKNNKVNLTFHPSQNGSVMASDYLQFIDTDLEYTVNSDDNYLGTQVDKRVATENLGYINGWNGYIDSKGAVLKLYGNNIDSVYQPLLLESPLDENFKYVKVGLYNYLAKTNGEILDNFRLISNVDDYSLKYTGGEGFEIPEMLVNDTIYSVNGYSDFYVAYGLSGISGYDNLKFEIISGSLPLGLSMSERGFISGRVTEVTPRGSVRIRATDKGNNNTCEFDLNYAGVISEPRANVHADSEIINLLPDESMGIQVRIEPSVKEANITAESSDPSVVEITKINEPIAYMSYVRIKALNPGHAYLTFTSVSSGAKYVTEVFVLGEITPEYSINYYNVDGLENLNRIKYTPNDSDILLLSPSKEGYVFNGWYTSKDFKTRITKIASGSNGNLNLYAKWTPIKYSIKFNKNSGTGTMKNQSFTYGKSLALTNNAFKKTGYRFIGWNTESDGSGVSYNNKANVNNLSINNGEVLNLYAIWEKLSYTITYNNVTTDETLKARNPVKYNVETFTFTLSSPKRDGYELVGWYSDKALKKKVTKLTISKGTTGNKTYYAKWKALTYKVRFNANGGTGSMKDLTFTYDKPTKLTKNAFKKDGYLFVGWNTSYDRTGKWFADLDEALNLSKTNGEVVTLYAQWDKVTG